MARRAALPGADELFGRSEKTPAAGLRAAGAAGGEACRVPRRGLHRSDGCRTQPKGPSGRVRHDEKITVYVIDRRAARPRAHPADAAARARAGGRPWTDRSRGDPPGAGGRRPSTEPRARSYDGCESRDARRDESAMAATRGRRRATPTAGFAVHLDNFEGPFDLLLQLISRHQLDITEVALSRVTDEFIAHLKAMGSEWELDADARSSWSSRPRCSTSRSCGCCRRPSSRTRTTWRCSRRATCCSRG